MKSRYLTHLLDAVVHRIGARGGMTVRPIMRGQHSQEIGDLLVGIGAFSHREIAAADCFPSLTTLACWEQYSAELV
jgi:hypothetical protein